MTLSALEFTFLNAQFTSKNLKSGDHYEDNHIKLNRNNPVIDRLKKLWAK